MVHTTDTATKATTTTTTNTTNTTNTAKAKAEAKAKKADEAKAEAKEARKALKEAEKASKKATKEAEKAEAKAKDCKPSEADEAKAKAKEAKAKAKKAETARKKADEAKAKAEAVETKAVAEATEARQAVKTAQAREAFGAKALTIRAEAVRRGLNFALRALLESAQDSETQLVEIEALLAFVGHEIPKGENAIRKAVQTVTKAELVTAYRDFSTYAIKEGESRKVAKAVRAFADCNCYSFEASGLFNIANIFRTPSANRRRGVKQFVAESGQYYEKVKGVFVPISKAEAEARIKTAKMQAEAEALRKAQAEAQAEADRKAGEEARKKAEAEARKARASKAVK